MSRKKLLFGAAASVAIASVTLFAQSRREPLLRQAVRGANMAVAAGSDYATDAGMKLSVAGGNAESDADFVVSGASAPSVAALDQWRSDGSAIALAPLQPLLARFANAALNSGEAAFSGTLKTGQN